MAPSCLSFVSLYNKYLNHSLSSAGLISQTISIDSETTIHFYGPKNNTSSKPKSKPPLVLIHGFGPHGMWQWYHQVHFFTTHFNVYIPDLIFFGKSTTKSQNRSEIFQATCVAKLLEKLEVKRYSLVGTSYGGFVAYRMATMWPERVDKVVFASSGVNLRRIDNERLLKRAGNKERIEEVLLPATVGELRTLMGLALFKKPYYMPQFLLNDCIEKLYAENRKEKMELLKGLTLGRDDTVNISPLQQEVLILWGDHDQIFLLEKATELKELLGNKVKLEVIKNCSHMPQLEHPGQFNNIINKFLCGSS